MKTLVALSLALTIIPPLGAATAIPVGTGRQLFVDHFLIDQLDGTRLQLHPPQPRGQVLRFDQPWEGIYSGYETVLQDGATLRLYYRGMPEAKHDFDTEVTCVAESTDGIHWTRPQLGLYEVHGSTANNVVLARSRGCHNFAPFIDTSPGCPPEQRYKAVGGTGKPGLLAFTSPDGLRWTQLQEQPIITAGAFDSQNNAFWSASENLYLCYFRVFRDGKRWVARSTSSDFVHWSEPVDLELDGQPRQHLYTNQIFPYPRAPHIYLGLPTRFMPGRRVVTNKEAGSIGTPSEWDYANDCTDIQLTSTRGGTTFNRTFMEAFVRPGLDLENWTSRANFAARGFVQTSDHELSFYVKHHAGYPSAHVRRYSLRPDGFASVHAGFAGGSFTTKTLTFSGSRLTLNFSTSAAGSIRVGLQSPDGTPIAPLTLDRCPEIVGDRLAHTVNWNSTTDLSTFAGKPVRLKFQLRDADLYSLKFEPDTP
ncbi:MAG: hypothetical protein P8J87_17655 [Verrucomicrobiales bacterium]|nr:hypothetical protein [Verrucomicrobiales bacterium]